MTQPSFDPYDFDAVMTRFGDMVYRLALSHTGHREDAEDVAQDVFLRYVDNCGRIESPEHCRAWLLRVTVNCCHSLHRRADRRRRATMSDELEALLAKPQSGEDPLRATFANDPEAELEDTAELDAADRERLRRALLGLSERYRSALYLFYYEELSVAEIADLMGAAQGTVKSLLSRGRKQLRAVFDGKDDGRTR
ncbi:MAG: sigma-70 family RNA polymerase sigma factor [Bacillota bacterium]|nr:sigma-70 family RNA polymerase sigma factor [Bacillota bacterium]